MEQVRKDKTNIEVCNTVADRITSNDIISDNIGGKGGNLARADSLISSACWDVVNNNDDNGVDNNDVDNNVDSIEIEAAADRDSMEMEKDGMREDSKDATDGSGMSRSDADKGSGATRSQSREALDIRAEGGELEDNSSKDSTAEGGEVKANGAEDDKVAEKDLGDIDNPITERDDTAAQGEAAATDLEEDLSETEQPETQQEDGRYRYVVRYGYLGFVGEFSCSINTLKRDQIVIVKSPRGTEVGRVLGLIEGDEEEDILSLPAAGSEPEDTYNPYILRRDVVMRYVEQSGPEYLQADAGRILRAATEEDLRQIESIKAEELMEREVAEDIAHKYNLPMRLVCVEHLFGGEKIIFYFTAPCRVDFRQMVRDLARRYRTRIELRQIGARDEARLLADYEICGRECCCKNFLKTLRPISMRMAKLQKSTLDPTKVSGRCGRLRCCLRYEHKTYEELVANLPEIGSWVSTAAGIGKVKDRSAITQLVQVVFGDNRLISFPADEVEVVEKPEGLEDIGIEGSDEISGITDEDLARLADQEEESVERPSDNELGSKKDNKYKGEDRADRYDEGKGRNRGGGGNEAEDRGEGIDITDIQGNQSKSKDRGKDEDKGKNENGGREKGRILNSSSEKDKSGRIRRGIKGILKGKGHKDIKNKKKKRRKR